MTVDPKTPQKPEDPTKAPPGYKNTEVGVIPEDWEVRTFDEVFDFLRTTNNSRAEFDDSGDVRYVHYGDIHVRWRHVLDFSEETLPFIHAAKVKNAALLCDGDLILADASEDSEGIGKSVEVKNLNGMKAVAGLHTFLLRSKDGLLSPGFKGYIQSQPGVRSEINRIATGLKVYGVSKNRLKDVYLPVPSLHEQRAIAAALSDVDALISALDALISKKRAVKTAAMQQLLTGKRRLPGFSGEWQTRRLGDVADIDCDNLAVSTDPDYQFKYISLEDVDKGTLRGFSQQNYSTAPSRARRRIRNGDVLVATVRPNLKSHLLFSGLGEDWICSTGFSVVRCKEDLAKPGFIYQHLFHGVFPKQIETLIAGSNYPAISAKDVKAFQISLPSIEEQTAIAEVLSDMDAEISALEARREKTRKVKRGVMQELLTGRTRLV